MKHLNIIILILALELTAYSGRASEISCSSSKGQDTSIATIALNLALDGFKVKGSHDRVHFECNCTLTESVPDPQFESYFTNIYQCNSDCTKAWLNFDAKKKVISLGTWFNGYRHNTIFGCD